MTDIEESNAAPSKAKGVTGPTQALAAFAAGVDLDTIPPGVREVARSALLDTVGCALLGSRFTWSRTIAQWVQDQDGAEESTLWQFSRGATAPDVALALGVMAHSYDFDDYHNAKVHPGAVVVPAAFALAEARGATGRELLTAIVAGYETMIRVSLATGPGASRTKGWHLTGTTGTFGAAAAAARLRSLDTATTASALGLAGTQSAGLWAFTADGSQSKRFHPGRSAQSGLIAADLAERGFLGPTQILEASDGGFCHATSDDYDLTRVTDRLGEQFLTEDVVIKPYACCGSMHSSIDAIRDLMGENELAPGAIDRVVCHTSPVVIQQCGYVYEPLSVLQAQMSGQYAIAVTILDGNALVPQFAPERIGQADVLELAGRVDFAVDPEIAACYPERFAGRVEVALRDGTRLHRRVDYPRGSRQNPMKRSDRLAKFHSLADEVVGRTRAAAIVEALEHVEEVDDVRELARLLR